MEIIITQIRYYARGASQHNKVSLMPPELKMDLNTEQNLTVKIKETKCILKDNPYILLF